MKPQTVLVLSTMTNGEFVERTKRGHEAVRELLNTPIEARYASRQLTYAHRHLAHGKLYTWRHGCRCAPCVAINDERNRQRRSIRVVKS